MLLLRSPRSWSAISAILYSRGPSLIRTAVSIALGLCAVPAFADSVRVNIAPERAGHTFSVTSTEGDGSWAPEGPFTTPSGNYGIISIAGDAQFPTGSYTLADLTVGEYLPLDGRLSAGTISPASTEWLNGSGVPSSRTNFLLPADRAADTFLVYTSSDVYPPVTVTNWGNFAEASAEIEAGAIFTLVDATNTDQLPDFATDGYSGGWFATALQLPFVNLYAIVPDSRLGYSFSLSSGSYYSSLTAACPPTNAPGWRLQPSGLPSGRG